MARRPLNGEFSIRLPVLPFVIFLIVILVVSIGVNELTQPGKPTAVALISSTPTPTPLPLTRETDTPTPLPSPPTSTKIPSPSAISTGDVITPLPPTQTPTPTPASTPTTTPLTGQVITINPQTLRVREEPGTCYRIIDRLPSDTEINIFGRIPDDDGIWDWLEIETPNGKLGYVSEQYIEVSGNLANLKVISDLVVENCTPTPTSSVVVAQNLNFSRTIDVEGRAESATLGPFEEHWYTFFEEDPETVVVFIFRPNVNFFGDTFVGYNMEFFLHDENQIPVWPPTDAEELKGEAIGVGSFPGVDRNGDLGTGELVWRGGPLVPGTRYYLRFVNRSAETIEYCLVPGDEFSWVCD